MRPDFYVQREMATIDGMAPGNTSRGGRNGQNLAERIDEGRNKMQMIKNDLICPVLATYQVPVDMPWIYASTMMVPLSNAAEHILYIPPRRRGGKVLCIQYNKIRKHISN